ncbi:MAG: endopeptidase La [Planctomycetia bacterium]
MAETPPSPPSPPQQPPPQASLASVPIPGELPGLCLFSTVVFPLDVVSVQVNRPRSLRMIAALEGESALVAVFFPRNPEAQDALTLDDLLPVGVACRVIHRMRMPNDTVQVVFQGLRRIRLREVLHSEPFLKLAVEPLDEREPRGSDIDGLIYRCMEMVDALVKAEAGYPPEMVNVLRMNIAGGGRFADLIAAHLAFPVEVKRRIVGTEGVRDRLRLVEEVLQEQLARAQVAGDVAAKVRADLDARQREHILRAQLKTIRHELGMDADGEAEVADLRERVAAAPLSDEARKAATRELDRMAGMPAASSEYHVARTYVAWILDLPWALPTRPPVDLARARAILDRDHAGLDDVKERILQFLAVRRLKDDPRGPILCLAGPPGVGKTSLGRSIAEALGRPFVRVSVGGMRDEAEVKGHRRTYVGAMPGKVLQGLKRAAARDAVFVLDEIDKMGSDARGDPSSAMLEVLDPEQNAAFLDHYLDLPFDLSRVFFVATANVLEDIPGPLRDRMEVVTLSGYTLQEKVAIARKHLLPRVRDEHGLRERDLVLDDAALGALIEGYTREAGVRDLQRRLAALCRQRAVEVASAAPGRRRPRPLRVRSADLERLLGAAPFEATERMRTPQVGVALGLAWTPAGGDILPIEATLVPGTGHAKLTGRLGEVMRESFDAAFTWLRSEAVALGIDPQAFRTHDVHLHVPAGATPKDGPSAGVTIATCLASVFSGRPVRADVAMTGEITLKGRVLPVGGIKEKVLAAHRAGVRTVLLPVANRKDLARLPAGVREGLEVLLTSEARRNGAAALLPARAPAGAAPTARAAAPRGSSPRPGGGRQAATPAGGRARGTRLQGRRG